MPKYHLAPFFRTDAGKLVLVLAVASWVTILHVLLTARSEPSPPPAANNAQPRSNRGGAAAARVHELLPDGTLPPCDLDALVAMAALPGDDSAVDALCARARGNRPNTDVGKSEAVGGAEAPARMAALEAEVARLTSHVNHQQRKLEDAQRALVQAGMAAKEQQQQQRQREQLQRIVPRDAGAQDTGGLKPRQKGPYLFILVMTVPDALDRRVAMRDTWLTYRGKTNPSADVVHRFLIGTAGLSPEAVDSLSREQAVYGDLALMPHFREEYSNLTGKLLDSMNWGYDHLGRFQYMFKVDDDTFTRLDWLLDELDAVPEADTNRYYWGYFDGRAEVRRKGKYKEMQWTVCDRYLPYAMGGGYVVSGALVEHVVASPSTTSIFSRFNAEDVSLGLWLAPLNITRRHDVRFDTEWKSRGCNNGYIVMHRSNVADMAAKHAKLVGNAFTNHCDVEFRKRVEYDYNWTALPSQCCPGRGTH